MDKELLLQLKEVLEKERSLVEQELSSFAKKDTKLPGDWDTQHPRVPEGNEEEAADEVEEYESNISVEQELELKLKEVTSALDRIAKGTYGTCEKCGEPIQKERLLAIPSARTCERCMSIIS
ncbi:MAG: TraR/DksA C4-type zinc finger protein [Parcubacteria group bacterium]|nr:TraR/DksA C4-type zinc finger protein [Parcubacteria group bacterium]